MQIGVFFKPPTAVTLCASQSHPLAHVLNLSFGLFAMQNIALCDIVFMY